MMESSFWDEQVERAAQLYWFMENDGKNSLTCENYQESYRRYYRMDIPLEKISKQSMNVFLAALVDTQHQRIGSRVRPLFITDDNQVKVKPDLRKKLFASFGINQDASIVSVKMRKSIIFIFTQI